MARFLPGRALRVSLTCVVVSSSSFALICLPLVLLREALAQGQPTTNAIPVEVVSTASEYVPLSRTVSHPGHSYTNCLGSTSYFGHFNSYGDFGSVSGTATTNTHCSTTFSLPREATLTTYRKVNYTITKGEQSLYLLSYTQSWVPTAFAQIAGHALAASGADESTIEAKRERAGKWSVCPAFSIGTKYTLTVNSISDAWLADTAGGKPRKSDKLEYLSSAGLSVPSAEPPLPPQAQAVTIPDQAKVHITSSPSDGEIYVDGKFFGNTPSDITIATGEHGVKVTFGGKEWSRTIQITSGEISLHAETPADK